jgi:hypothetical protein
MVQQQLTIQRINNLVVQLVQPNAAAIKAAAQMVVVPVNVIKANVQMLLVLQKADIAPNKV